MCLKLAEAFDAYPELLFVDATYKLLHLKVCDYFMLCEDSNEQSKIWPTRILKKEKRSSS